VVVRVVAVRVVAEWGSVEWDENRAGPESLEI